MRRRGTEKIRAERKAQRQSPGRIAPAATWHTQAFTLCFAGRGKPCKKRFAPACSNGGSPPLPSRIPPLPSAAPSRGTTVSAEPDNGPALFSAAKANHVLDTLRSDASTLYRHIAASTARAVPEKFGRAVRNRPHRRGGARKEIRMRPHLRPHPDLFFCALLPLTLFIPCLP